MSSSYSPTCSIESHSKAKKEGSLAATFVATSSREPAPFSMALQAELDPECWRSRLLGTFWEVEVFGLPHLGPLDKELLADADRPPASIFFDFVLYVGFEHVPVFVDRCRRRSKPGHGRCVRLVVGKAKLQEV